MSKLNIQKSPGLTITAFMSLAMVGVFHTILGTALPAMRLSFEMNVSQSGLLALAAWLGFTAAVFLGGALSDIFTRQRIMMLACLTTGLGSILLGAWRPVVANVILVSVVGAGTGIIVSSSSALIMDLYPRREGMIMNIHHFFYAVGAIGGPLAMGYVLQRGWHWKLVYRTGGIFMLILAGLSTILKRSGLEDSHMSYGSFFLLVKEKKLILLVLLTIFSIGTQNGIIFWLVSFLKEVGLFSISKAGLGLALLSAGMALGRLLSGWLTAKLGNSRVLLFLLILLSVALLLFHSVPASDLVLSLCFLTGIFCSGLFPCLLALGGICFPHMSGTTLGILGMAAGIGSSFISWSMGIVSELTSMKGGFFVANVAILVSLAVVLVGFKGLREPEQGYCFEEEDHHE